MRYAESEGVRYLGCAPVDMINVEAELHLPMRIFYGCARDEKDLVLW
jgi:hypothetical protein